MILSTIVIATIMALLIKKKRIGLAVSLLVCSLFFTFTFVLTNSDLSRICSHIFAGLIVICYLLLFSHWRKINLFGLSFVIAVIFNIVVVNEYLSNANNYIKESEITYITESNVYDEYLAFLNIAGYNEEDLKKYNQDQVNLMQTTIDEMNIFQKIEYYFYINEQTNSIVIDFQEGSVFEQTIKTTIDSYEQLPSSEQEIFSQALKETFGDYNE